MQMVAAIVSGQDLCGVAGVANSFVKIDDAVKFAAGADPGVDFLADLLILGAVEMIKERILEDCMLERRNRRADDADSFFVSAGDELTIAGDQVLSGDSFG